MLRHYRLNEKGEPEECGLIEWSESFGSKDRHLAKDYLTGPDGAPVFISTIFLGLDHGFGMGLGPPSEHLPVLWETMVFHGDWLDKYCERYTSKEDALEGHARAIAWAKEKIHGEGALGVREPAPDGPGAQPDDPGVRTGQDHREPGGGDHPPPGSLQGHGG